jgi:exodeoxyribonuclease VII small subunit
MKKNHAEEEELSFEAAMERLEAIALSLEDGELGIGEALEAYEKGIGYLRQCHKILREAERKILLVTDVAPDGSPVAVPFDESAMSLEEKQGARSRRRSAGGCPPGDQASASDMDIQQGLF